MRAVHKKPMVAMALFAAFALLPGTARAEIVKTPFLCNTGTAFTPNWIACSGLWSGNNVGTVETLEAVLTAMKTDFVGYGLDSWTVADNYIGTTNAGATNYPFSSVPSGTSGTITFSQPMGGLFVLILKGGDQFFMYLFDEDPAITEIQYSMADFPTNPAGNPPGLSHASLWADGVTVPEPSSLLLLGSGLLGLGVVGYRRRRN